MENVTSPNNLVSLLKRENLVSPNRFIVNLTRLPIQVRKRELLDNMAFTAYQVNLPLIGIGSDTYQLSGSMLPIMIPKSRKKSSITMSYYVTSNFYQRTVLEAWMDLVVDFRTNNVSYFNDIVGDMNVKMIDQTDAVVYDIDFINVYPVQLETIRLTWLITTEWTEQNTTWEYETFRVNKTETSIISPHFGKAY